MSRITPDLRKALQQREKDATLKTQVKKGVVRLYLEMRYDLPFSFDKWVPLKEAVNKVIADCGGLGAIPGHANGEYAEEVHAVLVDIDEGLETRAECFEGTDATDFLFEL